MRNKQYQPIYRAQHANKIQDKPNKYQQVFHPDYMIGQYLKELI